MNGPGATVPTTSERKREVEVKPLVDLGLEDPFRVRLAFCDREAQPRDLAPVPGFDDHAPVTGNIVLFRRDAAESGLASACDPDRNAVRIPPPRRAIEKGPAHEHRVIEARRRKDREKDMDGVARLGDEAPIVGSPRPPQGWLLEQTELLARALDAVIDAERA